MKNQNIDSANGKADFIDLKTAKNPFYQPMAGKSKINAEDKLFHRESSESVNPPVPLTAEKNEEPIKKDIFGKPALNLEGTLKLVEELHRRMVQRGRLVHTIDNLDKFEIEQKQEADDTMSNYYQGCELEITDDKRNKFSTKNPVIIKAVALYVRELCTNRLAEIEAEIIIPS